MKKKNFEKEILQFIRGQRVGVLAIEMPDGSPHGSAVHYAYSEVKNIFLFSAKKHYKKVEALMGKNKIRASLVIGVNDIIEKSLQMDGYIEFLDEEEKKLFDLVYIGKFPKKKEVLDKPESAFIKFIPLWWKFTDWENRDGKKIISSDE